MKKNLLFLSIILPGLLLGQNSFETHIGYNFQHINTIDESSTYYELLNYDKKSFYSDFAYTFLENKILNQKVGFSCLYREFDVEFNNPTGDVDYNVNQKLHEKSTCFQLFYLQKLDVFKKIKLKPEFGLGTSFLYAMNSHRVIHWEPKDNSNAVVKDLSVEDKILCDRFIPYIIVGLQYEQKIGQGKSLTLECLYSKNWNSSAKKYDYSPDDFEHGLHDVKLNIGYKQDISAYVLSHKTPDSLKSKPSFKKFVESKVSLEAGLISKRVHFDFIDESTNGGNTYNASYDPEKTSMNSYSLGVNIILRKQRLIFQTNFSYNKIRLDYYGTVSHYNQEGYWSYSDTYNMHYASHTNQLAYSLGLGFQILRPTSKINFVPMFEIDRTYSSNKVVMIDEYMGEHVEHNFFPSNPETYSYTYSEGKASEFLTDRTVPADFYSDGFMHFIQNCRMGLMIQYKIYKRVNLQATFSRFFTSLNYFGSQGIYDTRRFQLSFGFSYKIK